MSKKSKIKFPKKSGREAVFQPELREDLRYWVDTDRKIALRAFELIEAIMREPFTGIGKPEPLKYLAAGTWSHRLTQEHRLVYLVELHKSFDQRGQRLPSGLPSLESGEPDFRVSR